MSKATIDNSSISLNGQVRTALQKYFADLNGHPPTELYQLLLSEVERPLFETVLDHAGGNQSRSAEILGINRGTLRKKLKLYGLDD
ncbi:MAG: DNA-binding transcriptional regulator Fis [Gammaproteobacteria bacterium]|nr:DNA-binding transcriptional regulator Fis [Gammaproteobacteria bacterium]